MHFSREELGVVCWQLGICQILYEAIVQRSHTVLLSPYTFYIQFHFVFSPLLQHAEKYKIWIDIQYFKSVWYFGFAHLLPQINLNKAKSLLDEKFKGSYVFKAPYYLNVLSLSYVIPMSYPHHTHVISTSYPRHIHVISTSYPCHIHVISMSYPCHIHVISMSYPCHIHVISTSYSISHGPFRQGRPFAAM